MKTKKKKNRQKLIINYGLSILFILILTFFLISLIFIGRTMFYNNNLIKEHVAETKTLLNNIEKVENTVGKRDKYKQIAQPIRENLLRATNFDNEIKTFRYLNLKNSSLITFKISKRLESMDGIYYIKYVNSSEIKIGDFVLCQNNLLGKITNIENDEITVLDLDNLSSKQKRFQEIVGKIIFIDRESLKE